MALLVQDVLAGVKDRAPFYSPALVPGATVLRMLSSAEASVIALALQRNSHWLTQRASVFFAVDAANAVGVAGAGVGAFGVDETGAIEPLGGVGRTMSYPLTSPLDPARVVASAAGVVVTMVGAPYTADQFANQLAVVVAGTGAGPDARRVIVSHTTNALTLAAAFDVAPDSTSLLAIYPNTPVVDGEDRAVFGEPIRADTGYLTRIDANGVAYLDLNLPVVARYDVGIPLPVPHGVLKVLAWYRNQPRAVEITYAAPAYLGQSIRGPAYTIQGGALFLLGDWRCRPVDNLDVLYQPVPPALTSLAQPLLLPIGGRQALEAACAYAIAQRIARIEPTVAAVLSDMRADREREEQRFLASVIETGIARARSVVEVF